MGNILHNKVLDSVFKKFGNRKKFRIRFRSDFGYRHTLLQWAGRNGHVFTPQELLSGKVERNDKIQKIHTIVNTKL